ncbi:MAG: beta-galactosidase [Candidatus Limivicinus sp.]
MKQNKPFTYGAVLKVEREHSRADIRSMLADMHALGMNTVVVWPAVYWWEPQGEHYPYQTGRDLLADAEEIGIGVIMELAGQITAMEYAPDFLMKDEYFCVDRQGNRDDCGLGYGYLNFNHPEVKELIHKQYGEAAREYRDYPTLKGYDIWNETQFTSFDDHTLAHFRSWLQEKYGTLAALNDSWDRAYRSWEDIRFTQWMWASVMAFVDYQQFHKANIGMILRDMRSAIEAEDTVHEILADNIHASVTVDRYYDRPTDDWGVAQEVDQYGISFYPKFLSRFTPPFLRHQTMVGAHSAAPDGKFTISEMQTHHATMFNPEGSVSPQELWTWCWEAVSHGANGLIYWKWNPFRKGVQTFGRGLVDLQGRETPRTEVARKIGKVLAKEPEIVKCRPQRAVAAILYDALNHDFTKAYTIGFRGILGAQDSIYIDSLTGLYRTLWEHNVPVKFLTPNQLLKGEADEIPLLFVSTQVPLGEAMAQALKAYVAQGGVCICDGKLGEVDPEGLLYPQIPGAGLSEEMGFELLDMEQGDLTIRLPNGRTVQGGHDRRQMCLEEGKVQVAATFTDGIPAAVSASYGKGRFCYIATFLWSACKAKSQDSAYALIEELFGKALPIEVQCSESQVNVQYLTGDSANYLFAFNYGGPCTAKFFVPNAACPVENVLSGQGIGSTPCWQAELAGGELAIYKFLGAGEEKGHD